MPDCHSTSPLAVESEQRRFDSGIPNPFDECISKQSAAPTIYPMNLSISDQDAEGSSPCYFEGDQTSRLHMRLKRNLFEGSATSYTNRAIISQFWKKTTKKNSPVDHSLFFSSSNVSSSTTESSQEDRSSNSSKDSVQDLSLPLSEAHATSSVEGDRFFDEHLRAKRARVENIIRGMSSSPTVAIPSNELEKDGSHQQGGLRDQYKENKQQQKQHQQQQDEEEDEEERSPKNLIASSFKKHRREECHRLKQQLQEMQGKLLELQEKFFQVYDTNELEQEEEEDLPDANFPLDGTACKAENDEDAQGKFARDLSDVDHSLYIDYVQALTQDRELTSGKDTTRHQNTDRKFNSNNHFSFSLVEGRHLADALKYELSNAVAHIVDSVVQLFSVKPSSSSQSFHPFPPSRPKDAVQSDSTNLRMPSQELRCPQEPTIHQYFENPQTFDIQDQTEALPLVVRKSSQPSLVNPVIKPPCQIGHTSTALAIALGSQLPLNDLPVPVMSYGMHADIGHNLSSSAKDPASPESIDLSWETVKLRSKIAPHHMTQQPYSRFHQGPVDSLCLTHIKAECGDLHSLAEVSPYTSINIQEGLTPNHLKKAKLMFFYTRYPSSNTLKTYFPDVKFNRCITSQLIKWFSNFREFYYIQMEKSARQAMADGITDTNDLKVTRDCELFRALNMHYNKANDFQIPDTFLEVAEVTLREFFNAVYLGKDTDPAWKKGIYKVICKLDTKVPEVFKSQGCLQEAIID
ncbi:prospero homeobox protein 1 [Callorhinchus milii]|uniref:prospero homeobox protein 1 n=1 Tax=Callorhinchus milii TaxID=7868 RepID=UPI001C3FEBBF|nr:prospero homeobox protein 1 [Callorhinchus milii]